MLDGFFSLKCLKKCLHNVQKPTCHDGDKRFLFVAIPTFDIGSLNALLAFLFVFMALKRVVRVVLIRTISILTGHHIMFSFAKQYHKISILPSQKGLKFPGGWGVL